MPSLIILKFDKQNSEPEKRMKKKLDRLIIAPEDDEKRYI